MELRAPSITLPEHPANVRVEETTLGIVRIFDRVRESVVNSVVVTPAEARAFKGPSSHHQERCLDDRMGVVGAMRPQSVVPRSDANATDVEHNEGQDGCLELDANKERRNDTEEGGHDEPNGDSPIELGEQSADAETGAVVSVQVLPQRGLLDALENMLNELFLIWKCREISYLVEFALHRRISFLDVVARDALNVVRGSHGHVVQIVRQQLDPLGELDRREREGLEIFASGFEIFLELFFSVLKILLQLLLSVADMFFVLVVSLFSSLENCRVRQLMRFLERAGPEVIDRQRNEIVLEQAPPAEVHGH